MLRTHALASSVGFVLIAGAAYWGYGKLAAVTQETRYVVGAVEQGTLITSISGSGQVAALNQVDVKSKASGDSTYAVSEQGGMVRAGSILAQLDSRDAQKAVRDAQANLQSAELALRKLTQPADASTKLSAENALQNSRDNVAKLQLSQQTNVQNAQDAKQKAQDAITKSYEDSFNTIANAFLNLPTIITALNDALYSNTIGAAEISVGKDQWNTWALLNTTSRSEDRDALQVFQKSAENDYKTARAKYDTNFNNYKNASRYSERPTIEMLLSETLETTKSIAQAAKSESNYFDAWVDFRTKQTQSIFTSVKTYQTNLATYTGQTNTHLSNLLSLQRTLQDNKDALRNAEKDLAAMAQNNPLDMAAAEALVQEKQSSLLKLKAGPDPLDIESQKLSVQQRHNALLDAQEKLSDYTIRAPFDGMVAKMNVKKGDPVASGTVVAILITTQRTATISLNEVDAAKIQTAQKATLSFDAIPELTIAGEVAEIDTLGTVSQGVVTYAVKILFDTQDARVKPGMSVSAAIVTAVRQNVLMVANSAVKSQGNTHYYVEMFNQPLPASSGNQGTVSATPPTRRTIEIGLSNDTSTEITSGLEEGDQIVVRTIAAATKTTATQAPSLIGGGGGRGFGGGGR